MDYSKTFIKVFGTRYRCSLQYVSLQSLDPLAEFVLKMIHNHRSERKLTRLIGSLGLTERLMEDILAELVLKNYAALDIKKGEIKPIGHPESWRRPVYDERGVIDLWQDHSTGAVLPANLIGQYSEKVEDVIPLPPMNTEQFNSFFDIPDGLLIALIERVDPNILFGNDPEWILDRLTNRLRLSSQPIYIEMATTELDQITYHYADAFDLPDWVTRTWTSIFRGIKLKSSGEEITARTRFEPVDDRPQTSILHPIDSCQIKKHADIWLDSVRLQITSDPPPESIHEIQSSVNYHRILQDRLNSVIHIRCTRPNEDEYLNQFEETLLTARQSVVALVSDLSAIKADTFVKTFEKYRKHLLITIVHNRKKGRGIKGIVEFLASHNCELIEIDGHPAHKSDILVADGQISYIGNTKALFSKEATVKIQGKNIGNSLIGFIQNIIPITNPKKNIFNQHIRRRSFLVSDRKEIDSITGKIGDCTITDVINKLIQVDHDLRNAITEYQLIDTRQDYDDRSCDEAADGGGNCKNIAEAFPGLVRQIDDLGIVFHNNISTGFSPHGFIVGMEQKEILESGLRKITSKDNTIYIVSEISPAILEESNLLDLINGILEGSFGDQKWIIKVLFYGPSLASQKEIAQKLKGLLVEGFQVSYTQNNLPFGCCIVDDIVSVGTYNLLRDFSFNELNRTFSVVVKSEALAEEILELSTSRAVDVQGVSV